MPSPTLLMIAPFFPPRRRVGAQRPFRLVKELPAKGWNPAVVALESKGRLSEAERRVLEQVPVHRISLPWDRTQKQETGDSRGMEGGMDGKGASNLAMGKGRGAGADRTAARAGGGAEPWFADWIDRMMPLDTWWPAMMLDLPGIRRFARSQHPDALWSTGDPWSSHWLALRLKAELEVPWIADFRDPWTLSTVPLRARSTFAATMDRRMERRVMEMADRIVFTCQAAADRYAAHYPGSADRIRVVYNCAADPSEVDGAGSSAEPPSRRAEPPSRRAAEASNRVLEILFAGRFRRLSPVDPVLAMLKAFRSGWEPRGRVEGDDAGRIDPPMRLHHIGALDAADKARVDTEGLADWFVEHPEISQEQLLGELAAFDLLLLSTHPSRTDIIPAKLWDYLAADRPILSLCPNPEIATWLDASSAGVQFEPGREGEAAAWLAEAVRSFRRDGRLVAAAPVARRPGDLWHRISSANMADRLADILMEVVR